MLKLLFTLTAFLLLALTMLGLRQHCLELESQEAKLGQQIREREYTLRGQRVGLTKGTNPKALAEQLRANGWDLGESYTPAAVRTVRNAVRHDNGDRDLIAPLRRHGRQ